MADLDLRSLERIAATGDQTAIVRALSARVRADDRALAEPFTCSHCSRQTVQVDLGVCGGCQFDPISNSRQRSCIACDGTGRREWSWEPRLTLAAYSGDPAARSLLDWGSRTINDAGTVVYSVPEGLDLGAHWCLKADQEFSAFREALDHWPDANLIAALAAGWAVLPVWEGKTDAGDYTDEDGVTMREALGLGDEHQMDDRPRHALRAAVEHVRCGCQESAKAWRAVTVVMPAPLDWVARAVEVEQRHLLDFTVTVAARVLDEPRIRAAVKSALIAWALRGEVIGG